MVMVNVKERFPSWLIEEIIPAVSHFKVKVCVPIHPLYTDTDAIKVN